MMLSAVWTARGTGASFSAISACGPRSNISGGFEQVAKVPLAKHNDMIQAIPPGRAEQSLRISVLPRRSCRSRPVTNAHRMKAAGKNVAGDVVSVTDDVTWRRFPTKGLRDLTGDPFSRWVCSNPETQDLAATVLQYQQSIEQSEGISGVHEQVHRRDAVSMIMQERPPALGWTPPRLCHVFGDRGLPDIDAELKEFTVNAWCAPERISDIHVADELSGPM